MATIGSLLVSLKANTAEFDTKVKSSARGLRSFEQTAKSVSAGVTGAFMKLAAVAGGISLFKSAATEASNFGKFASVLKDTTANMQALSYAASQNDTSFAAVSTALVKMQRSINDAKDGTGTLASTFRSLGVNVQSLSHMKATDQFATIADALNRAGDAAGNAGFDIFGRNVAEITVLLQAGSKAIDQATMKMKAFGLSEQQISNIKRAEERLLAMGIQARAVAAIIVARFGPTIIGALNGLSTSIQGIIGWWDKMNSGTRRWVETGLQAASVAFVLNKAMVFSAIAKGVDIIFSLAGAWRAYATATKAAAVSTFILETVKGGWAGLAKAALMVTAVAGGMYALNKAFDSATQSIVAGDTALGAHADKLRASADEHLNATGAADGFNASLQTQANNLREIQGILSTYSQNVLKGIGFSQLDFDKQKLLDLGATPEEIDQLIQAAKSISNLEIKSKFKEDLAELAAETRRLTLSAKQLAEVEWRTAGFDNQMVIQLRDQYELNERIRRSKEAQIELQKIQRTEAEQTAAFFKTMEEEQWKNKVKDLDRISQMEVDASPTLKYKVEKEELDKLKDLGLSDEAYKVNLTKLQDQLKQSLGIDTAQPTTRQNTLTSTRTGMLQYALMGGKTDEEKADRKEMKEYLRILVEEARNRDRLRFA